MGLFITLEGIDGAGKSTQARLLRDGLESAGHQVVLTREPGGSTGAEEIRQLLVEGEPGRWSATTEMLLFTAARRDHVERTIRPALAAGKVVVCDRFVDSTRAYQGDGPGRTIVDQLHTLTIGLDADLTLIFDLDPVAGLSRASARSGAEDRFERRGVAFQNTLRTAFLAIAKAEPERCHVVDAQSAPHEVASSVWTVISKRLG